MADHALDKPSSSDKAECHNSDLCLTGLLPRPESRGGEERITPDQSLTLTLMVRSKASPEETKQAIDDVRSGKREPLTDAEIRERFSADPRALAHIDQVLQNNPELKKLKSDPRTGMVVIGGSLADLKRAFQEDGAETLGVLGDKAAGTTSKSAEVDKINQAAQRMFAKDVEGVFDTDRELPIKDHLQVLDPTAMDATPAPRPGYLPNQWAQAYKFPGLGADGQAAKVTDQSNPQAHPTVAILTFDGCLDNGDYYKRNNLGAPNISIISVDGKRTDNCGTHGAIETTLDSQILGAVAPFADQQVYFGPKTEQGFIDVLTRAVLPESGEKQNDAISMSWDAPEGNWSKAGLQAMHRMFEMAALKGMTVSVASGDDGGFGESPTGKYMTYYPASDPLVTSLGGTTPITHTDAGGHLVIDDEVVWNNDWGASGGGYSQDFSIPTYQNGIDLGKSANWDDKPGRGIPDVSAVADPQVGFQVFANGKDITVGGTSASAPFFLAEVLLINRELGKKTGFLNDFLYAPGNRDLFTPVIKGNNNPYQARAPWSAATGLGSIRDGQELLRRLKSWQPAPPPPGSDSPT